MEICLIAVTCGMLCWSALGMVEQHEFLTLPLEAQWQLALSICRLWQLILEIGFYKYPTVLNVLTKICRQYHKTYFPSLLLFLSTQQWTIFIS